jgi:hypothetical protein
MRTMTNTSKKDTHYVIDKKAFKCQKEVIHNNFNCAVKKSAIESFDYQEYLINHITYDGPYHGSNKYNLRV